jgi:predicted metalloprotease
MPGGGRLGLGGLLLLVVVGMALGVDPLALLGGLEGGTRVELPSGAPGGAGPPVSASAGEETLVDFVSFVLDDAQRVSRMK